MSAPAPRLRVVTDSREVTISRTKQVKVKNKRYGYHTFKAVGRYQRSAEIEVTVDLEAVLLELGPRALASKGRKAKALAGAVLARVVGKVSESEPVPVPLELSADEEVVS